tara:strand:+ start:8755 stop:9564 length:810 start_codon:yes stop_codon:yes gene_type:complete
MRNFINFFIEKIDKIIFLLLLIISFSLILNRNFFQNSKFNFFSNGLISSINNQTKEIDNYLNLRNENTKLKRENLNLKIQLNSKTKNSNATYKSGNYNFNTAEIITNSIKYSRNYLMINKGSNDSVKLDDGLVTNNGIIGIINKVSPKYSTAISILNSDLKINAKIKRTNHFGSLEWNGENHKSMTLHDIPKSANIKINDSVVSGGMSFIFQENIPIGKVKNIKLKDDSNYYLINVELFEDLSSLNSVYIISNYNKDELDNLNIYNEID